MGRRPRRRLRPSVTTPPAGRLPTCSSWLNTNTRELVEAIATYQEATNDDPTPFVWTKTADKILASVARFCHRTSPTRISDLFVESGQ